MAKRGRPPGSKNKKNGQAPDGAPAQQPVGPGHNVPDDATIEALTRDYRAQRAKLVAAEKKTKADRLNLDKKIKADLGKDGLNDIKLLDELSTPEGELEFKARIERESRVARWAGMQIGTQAGLFDDDRRPIEERAFDDGRRAGLNGDSLKNPHAPGSLGHEPYAKGWHQGQTEIFAIKPKVEPTADVIKTEKSQKPAEADEFDQAADEVTAKPPEETADPAAQKGEAPWPDDVQIEGGAAKGEGGAPEGATVN